MPEPATCDPAQGIDRMGSMSDEPDGLDRLQKLSPCDEPSCQDMAQLYWVLAVLLARALLMASSDYS